MRRKKKKPEPVVITGRVCGTCVYFADNGDCRLNPPVVTHVERIAFWSFTKPHRAMQSYPKVTPHFGCGQHQYRPAPPGQSRLPPPPPPPSA